MTITPTTSVFKKFPAEVRTPIKAKNLAETIRALSDEKIGKCFLEWFEQHRDFTNPLIIHLEQRIRFKNKSYDDFICDFFSNTREYDSTLSCKKKAKLEYALKAFYLDGDFQHLPLLLDFFESGLASSKEILQAVREHFKFLSPESCQALYQNFKRLLYLSPKLLFKLLNLQNHAGIKFLNVLHLFIVSAKASGQEVDKDFDLIISLLVTKDEFDFMESNLYEYKKLFKISPVLFLEVYKKLIERENDICLSLVELAADHNLDTLVKMIQHKNLFSRFRNSLEVEKALIPVFEQLASHHPEVFLKIAFLDRLIAVSVSPQAEDHLPADTAPYIFTYFIPIFANALISICQNENARKQFQFHLQSHTEFHDTTSAPTGTYSFLVMLILIFTPENERAEVWSQLAPNSSQDLYVYLVENMRAKSLINYFITSKDVLIRLLQVKNDKNHNNTILFEKEFLDYLCPHLKILFKNELVEALTYKNSDNLRPVDTSAVVERLHIFLPLHTVNLLELLGIQLDEYFKKKLNSQQFLSNKELMMWVTIFDAHFFLGVFKKEICLDLNLDKLPENLLSVICAPQLRKSLKWILVYSYLFTNPPQNDQLFLEILTLIEDQKQQIETIQEQDAKQNGTLDSLINRIDFLCKPEVFNKFMQLRDDKGNSFLHFQPGFFNFAWGLKKMPMKDLVDILSLQNKDKKTPLDHPDIRYHLLLDLLKSHGMELLEKLNIDFKSYILGLINKNDYNFLERFHLFLPYFFSEVDEKFILSIINYFPSNSTYEDAADEYLVQYLLMLVAHPPVRKSLIYSKFKYEDDAFFKSFMDGLKHLSHVSFLNWHKIFNHPVIIDLLVSLINKEGNTVFHSLQIFQNLEKFFYKLPLNELNKIIHCKNKKGKTPLDNSVIASLYKKIMLKKFEASQFDMQLQI